VIDVSNGAVTNRRSHASVAALRFHFPALKLSQGPNSKAMGAAQRPRSDRLCPLSWRCIPWKNPIFDGRTRQGCHHEARFQSVNCRILPGPENLAENIVCANIANIIYGFFKIFILERLITPGRVGRKHILIPLRKLLSIWK
jgi:hypothetical protein